MGKWKRKEETIFEIEGRNISVTLEPTPGLEGFIELGLFKARLFYAGEYEPVMAMSWPRYYMDLERAKREIEQWLSYKKEI